VAGDDEAKAAPGGTISAVGKHVVVIGGGDTGSDCIGTANRQGAASITQLEIMPEPPAREDKALTWPYWPLRLRTSSSQEEGCDRDFSVVTTAFEGSGRVERLRCARVRWAQGRMEPVADSEFEIEAGLVLLAMGFTGSALDTEAAGIATHRDVVRADPVSFRTDRDRVFACGDVRRGQSLVVWAIREGRDCAASIHAELMSKSFR
jgi:glutamate synthase (NADPH/NADH) small chain